MRDVEAVVVVVVVCVLVCLQSMGGISEAGGGGTGNIAGGAVAEEGTCTTEETCRTAHSKGEETTNQAKYFLPQFHYNSGFNDKRTRWFYRILRLAKEMPDRTLVRPSFNVRTHNDTYTEHFQPFEDFFDPISLSEYVPSISLAEFYNK